MENNGISCSYCDNDCESTKFTYTISSQPLTDDICKNIDIQDFTHTTDRKETANVIKALTDTKYNKENNYIKWFNDCAIHGSKKTACKKARDLKDIELCKEKLKDIAIVELTLARKDIPVTQFAIAYTFADSISAIGITKLI